MPQCPAHERVHFVDGGMLPPAAGSGHGGGFSSADSDVMAANTDEHRSCRVYLSVLGDCITVYLQVSVVGA